MTSKNEILLPISDLIGLIGELRDIPGVFHRKPLETLLDKHSSDITRYISGLEETTPEMEELLLISLIWGETMKNLEQELLK